MPGFHQARIVAYADDFVILSRSSAAEALAWTRQVMAKLGLTLNEAKTAGSGCPLRALRLSWLLVRPTPLPRMAIGISGRALAKKSVPPPGAAGQRPLVPATWEHGLKYEIAETAYCAAGPHTSATAPGCRRTGRSTTTSTTASVTSVRRHKVPTRGTNRFNHEAVFGALE